MSMIFLYSENKNIIKYSTYILHAVVRLYLPPHGIDGSRISMMICDFRLLGNNNNIENIQPCSVHRLVSGTTLMVNADQRDPCFFANHPHFPQALVMVYIHGVLCTRESYSSKKNK